MMTANRLQRLRAACALAACLCAATAARAGGIDYQIKYVPDFDQKRGPGSLTLGLPNEGRCYCMPTSAMNWIALLANRGYPQFGPPGNWQNADRYNIVTAALDDLGMDMDTSPGGPDPNDPKNNLPCGTGGEEAVDALVNGFNALAPGKFVVTMHYASGTYAPTYTNLVNAMLNGSLVLLRYGHYEEVIIPVQGIPAYARDGGHIMSLTGVQNFNGLGTRLRFRNPSSDESPDVLTAQSMFTTEDSSVLNVTTVFGGHTRTQTRLPDVSSNPKFIDGYIQIKPLFGLHVPDCCNDLQMHGMNPIPAIHGNPPQNAVYVSPNGLPFVDIEIHPELNRYFAITAGAAGGGPAKLLTTDPAGPTWVPLFDLAAPTSMTFGRSGELFVLDGASLRVIDPDAAPPAGPQIGAVSIPGAPINGRIGYDDGSDEVVGISSTTHELVRIKWDPAGSTVARKALPPGVSLSGSPMVSPSCISPLCGGWIASQNGTSVYKVQEDAAGALQIVDQINLAPVLVGGEINAMHVDTREHVLLARGGVIVEFERVGGIWQNAAQSDFAGLPVGKHMRIAASRNNFDPATMTGPEQLDVLPATDGPTVADCLADIAPAPLGNGVVDIDDLLLLINGWGPCAGTPELCPADMAPGNVGNAVVDIDDLLMVINAWGPCP